jgi:hypothetical protein
MVLHIHQMGEQPDPIWSEICKNYNYEYHVWKPDQVYESMCQDFSAFRQVEWKKLSLASCLQLCSWYVTYKYGGWFFDRSVYFHKEQLDYWHQVEKLKPDYVILEPSTESNWFTQFLYFNIYQSTPIFKHPFVHTFGWYAPRHHRLFLSLLEDFPRRYKYTHLVDTHLLSATLKLTSDFCFYEALSQLSAEKDFDIVHTPIFVRREEVTVKDEKDIDFSIEHQYFLLQIEELHFFLPLFVIFLLICFFFSSICIPFLLLLGCLFLMFLFPDHLWFSFFLLCFVFLLATQLFLHKRSLF